MTNSWVVAGIALLCLLCGLAVGSAISERRKDKLYAQGWDKCAATIRRRQLEHLRAGLILALDEDGPYWYDPAGKFERTLTELTTEVSNATDQENVVASGSHGADPGHRGRRFGRDGLEGRAMGGDPIAADHGDLVADLGGNGVGTAARARTSDSGGGGELAGSPWLGAGAIGPEWDPAPTDRIARDARYHQAPAPAPPPAGAGQMVPRPRAQAAEKSGSEVSAAHEPGDSLFAALDDEGAFALIRWELRRLAWMASEPFALTAWQATA